MTTRRPWILWGAALLLALLGVLAGASFSLAAKAIWMAAQPRTLIFGWTAVAAFGLASLVWLAAVIWLFGRLRGPGRWIFAMAAAVLAICPVVIMKLEKPGLAETITLTPAEAQTWKTARP
ncbi:hypothetical protein [Brevundimonas goettingensis]|uniref:Uncharacterized protein n=1 Tax=Brevundimonas goettingensis TaxID=2774190 RepID=A0A975GWC2_9CAUL|nr:hypothetical protein [Brevundimonas goettingensis]QTC91614.1 hypothetical protein IFJ75_01360 [Brevundimonas goettingensis]